MGQALYRKYRSKQLSEIVGQEHITTALDHAIKTGRISHAYLFTGPRGVGKTSIARILAHQINELPYTDESMHLDIIEIDAASNRRIDEIRDIRDKVHTAPASAKYKIYIIDEVHMLTKEAFNALLKTLEEPPAHVIFILATTEAHKLPETIISRTQRYSFKPIEPGKVVAHLAEIAQLEGLKIDTAALELIAKHGGGSFRDSISLLDQVGNYADQISAEYVRSMLGIASQELISTITSAMASSNALQCLEALQQAREQGIPAAQIAGQLGIFFRSEVIASQSSWPLQRLPHILERLLTVAGAQDPGTQLEIVLLEYILSGSTAAPSSSAAPVQVAAPPPHVTVQPARTAPKATPQPVVAAPAPAPASQPEPAPAPVSIPDTTPESTPESEQAATRDAIEASAEATVVVPETVSVDGEFDGEAAWQQLLQIVKRNQNTLYGVLRLAKPVWKDDTLELTFKFGFHQKRIQDAKNRSIVLNTISQVVHKNINLVCLVDETMTTNPLPPPPPLEPLETPVEATQEPEKPAQDISVLSNIFGNGVEVLDS